MKKIFSLSIALMLALLTSLPSDACTSAIFTGKATPDGRPLLWKHRDTGELNNRIEFFPAGNGRKYGFIGLVNSPVTDGEVWTGTNEVGFSIMNTASYNLQSESADVEDQEGSVMYQALGSCKTLGDFERMLDKMKRPLGVEANFGVIDAEGGAAYYEVNNTSWTKIDVNDPKVAPEGFLVYTNHSYTGRKDGGMGYVRYNTANEIFHKAWIQGVEITPQWIFNSLSRSYYNSLLGIDLNKNPELAPEGWFVDQDFIPRRSTSASIVVKGVKKDENPDLTVMWTILGYPPCGIAVPLFAAAGKDQPSYMLKRADSDNCVMCDETLARRARVFPLSRGNGKNYFDVGMAQYFMHMLFRLEDANFQATGKMMEKQYEKGRIDRAAISSLYEEIQATVPQL
ncbi:MAG: hypothetical protein IJ636_02755 [Bacteroidales bacterium]|nr:hypothetical protein [Bacteroidales bacterium]